MAVDAEAQQISQKLITHPGIRGVMDVLNVGGPTTLADASLPLENLIPQILPLLGVEVRVVARPPFQVAGLFGVETVAVKRRLRVLKNTHECQKPSARLSREDPGMSGQENRTEGCWDSFMLVGNRLQPGCFRNAGECRILRMIASRELCFCCYFVSSFQDELSIISQAGIQGKLRSSEQRLNST